MVPAAVCLNEQKPLLLSILPLYDQVNTPPCMSTAHSSSVHSRGRCCRTSSSTARRLSMCCCRSASSTSAAVTVRRRACAPARPDRPPAAAELRASAAAHPCGRRQCTRGTGRCAGLRGHGRTGCGVLRVTAAGLLLPYATSRRRSLALAQARGARSLSYAEWVQGADVRLLMVAAEQVAS